jgi:Domain of unknown function (DUF1843)
MSEHGSDGSQGSFRPLYAAALQEGARSGDASRMRELEQQAERHLQEVRSGLEALRGALAKHNK